MKLPDDDVEIYRLALGVLLTDPAGALVFTHQFRAAVELGELFYTSLEDELCAKVVLATLGELSARRIARLDEQDRADYLENWMRLVRGRVEQKVEQYRQAALQAEVDASRDATKH